MLCQLHLLRVSALSAQHSTPSTPQRLVLTFRVKISYLLLSDSGSEAEKHLDITNSYGVANREWGFFLILYFFLFAKLEEGKWLCATQLLRSFVVWVMTVGTAIRGVEPKKST